MHSRASIALLASSLIATAASAQSTQAVEWKVSEGGNGHWYKLLRLEGPSQSAEEHFLIAESLGAHTVTITSSAENAFCKSLIGTSDPIIGVRKLVGTNQGAWITGETWSYTDWHSGEGGNSWERYANLQHLWVAGAAWQDTNLTPCAASLVEWESDCNGDGIVDYGQIQSGELIDLNANGIPDICETSISSVIPPSVPSQGGSTITIRGNFPPNPAVLIGGLPASDINRVSISEIRAKTPALLPGMASVKVNDFILAEALYIRPECGSDLDQDGQVTAADIAIVLLDFGPCYATATSTQQEDSTPFMLREQADAAAPRAK